MNEKFRVVISAEQLRPLHCPAFVKLTTQQKTQLVKDKQLCFKWLSNHRSTDCTSARRRIIDNCGGKHHSTLHRNQDKYEQWHTQKSNNINLENQVNAKYGSKNQLQFMPINFNKATTKRFLATQFWTIAQLFLCPEMHS